ncbi:host-nuclease inhibitor Gam family protein, partial [Enterococcus malodoratus]
MNTLEKYEIEELEQTSVDGWSINDIGGADWALRKISALQSQNDEIKKFADLERERIASWEAKETESNNDRISFFEMKLSEYLNKLRKDDPKARIKTPHGTVGTRKVPDKWEYSSEAVAE